MQFTDQMARSIELEEPPRRIVSLVPSQSELLWDLGLHKEIAGITKFCIHPQSMFRSVERVGGTKKLDLEKIERIGPDLIIGNKEENDRAQIEYLEKNFPVWMSDIVTIQDALSMIENVAQITGRQERGRQILQEVQASLQACAGIFRDRSAAYFMWNEPLMCAGGRTFIGQMMAHIGLRNVIKMDERYPVIDAGTLKKLNPEICLLSTEPFPFAENHVSTFREILPASKVVIADGEIFSWYGSRMRLAGEYFKSLAEKPDLS